MFKCLPAMSIFISRLTKPLSSLAGKNYISGSRIGWWEPIEGNKNIG